MGLFFFFSSRRRHTRCSRDWSSDVCSSDLGSRPTDSLRWSRMRPAVRRCGKRGTPSPPPTSTRWRSEERRVGEEGRSRWSPYHLKKKKKKEVRIVGLESRMTNEEHAQNGSV